MQCKHNALLAGPNDEATEVRTSARRPEVADAALGEDYKGAEDRDDREEDVATPAVRAGRTKASWIPKFVRMLSLCHWVLAVLGACLVD